MKPTGEIFVSCFFGEFFEMPVFVDLFANTSEKIDKLWPTMGHIIHLDIRTYAVIPLNEEYGLIEWIHNTAPYRIIVHKLYRLNNVAVPPVSVHGD